MSPPPPPPPPLLLLVFGEGLLVLTASLGKVNPVGFTIGSLDGAYVRVGTHTPAPTIRVVEQWSHQELRRRDLVEA